MSSPSPLGPSGPLVPPLYQSSVYTLPDLDALDRVMNGEEPGYIYARDAHPNGKHLAARLAAIEGATWALVGGSGMAAISTIVLALVQQGQRIVASNRLYGRTMQLFEQELGRFGVQTAIVDCNDLAAVDGAAANPDAAALCGDDVQPAAACCRHCRAGRAGPSARLPAHRRQHLRHAGSDQAAGLRSRCGDGKPDQDDRRAQRCDARPGRRPRRFACSKSRRLPASGASRPTRSIAGWPSAAWRRLPCACAPPAPTPLPWPTGSPTNPASRAFFIPAGPTTPTTPWPSVCSRAVSATCSASS